jgi:hypothetical protein
MKYFNAVGIPGWFVSGSILKKKEISSGAMQVYDKAISLIKLTDKVIFNRVGLSVWFVAEKID